jgi:hypothetical protein
MKLKEFWGVTTVFDDRGNVKAYVGSTLSFKKPESTKTESKSCDRYIDWFDTEKEARSFAADAKKA